MFREISFVCGIVSVTMVGFTSQASAGTTCKPAKGKITNNMQLNGMTLGVVSLNLDDEKFKCAILGEPQASSPPDFRHTVVCDNRTTSDEPQAQVTFNTFFSAAPSRVMYCPEGSPGGPVSFSFEELSVPDPTTARGMFQGITSEESSIHIEGNFNCQGGIQMKFEGELCFTE